MALHIRILASGSFLTISRTASMPPISGITISIVTRSGFSWRYFSTACVPVSASPTTSNPACARMSVIIVRMKMASSQTRTVWLTARSLSSQNRPQQRRHIQQDEQLTVAASHRSDQRGVDPAQPGAVFQRRVPAPRFPRYLHVDDFAHPKADQLASRSVLTFTFAPLEDDGRTRYSLWDNGGRRGRRLLP